VGHIPTGGGASSRTTPLLIQSRGADVGLRYSPDRSTLVAVSAWGLDMESEHVFLGDQVTPARSRPSRRTGADLSARFDLGGAVHLDAEATYARARFTDQDPTGDRIPGAVEGVGSAGIEYSSGRGGHAGLRMRHVGPRPLTLDGSVRAPASTLWDAEVGYRSRGRWAALLEFWNLLDRRVSDSVYFYVSRLPGEPVAGVADLHTHPEPPRTVRLTLSMSWPRPFTDQDQQRTIGYLGTRSR
jgi:outer membrane receptor protein involved in Fe transport